MTRRTNPANLPTRPGHAVAANSPESKESEVHQPRHPSQCSPIHRCYCHFFTLSLFHFITLSLHHFFTRPLSTVHRLS